VPYKPRGSLPALFDVGTGARAARKKHINQSW